MTTDRCNQRLLAPWASLIIALKLYAVRDGGNREQGQWRTETKQRQEGVRRRKSEKRTKGQKDKRSSISLKKGRYGENTD